MPASLPFIILPPHPLDLFVVASQLEPLSAIEGYVLGQSSGYPFYGQTYGYLLPNSCRIQGPLPLLFHVE